MCRKILRLTGTIFLVFAILGLFGCVQPVNYERLIREAGDVNGGNGDNGDEVHDGSPILMWAEPNETEVELERNATKDLSLGAATPTSATVRIFNSDDFILTSIEWRHQTAGVLTNGENRAVLAVNPSLANSPFTVKGNHILTVEATGTNLRPYSTYITIRVVD
ncbi:MAG: hypothetical protein FWG77_10070 [Treponema sp.]|nr:hypothetical protein [Treponema sp.]